MAGFFCAAEEGVKVTQHLPPFDSPLVAFSPRSPDKSLADHIFMSHDPRGVTQSGSDV